MHHHGACVDYQIGPARKSDPRENFEGRGAADMNINININTNININININDSDSDKKKSRMSVRPV